MFYVNALANPGQFPTDLSQLQPYFNPPVDPSILQRWEVAPKAAVPSLGMGGDWIITQVAIVDADYDERYGVGLGGYGTASPQDNSPAGILRPVFEAYTTANNGTLPADISQLVPYATTPEQQAALQLAIKRAGK
jgi:hypothetical protein